VALLLAARAAQASSFVYVRDEPGNFVFYGKQFYFDGAQGEFNVFPGVPRDTFVFFAVPGFAWLARSFEFALRLRPPAPMEALSPGTYEYTFPGDEDGPQIDVGPGGWGCFPSWGRFTVHEVDYPYGPHSMPTRLSVDFEVDCGNGKIVHGAVRYHSGDGVCADAADGTPCDDHDPCTQEDACTSGTCAGRDTVSETCAPGGTCRDLPRCDPTSGQCATGASDFGTPCDDGNLCTNDDRCDGVAECRGVFAPANECSAPGGRATTTLEVDARPVRSAPALSWRFRGRSPVSAEEFLRPLEADGSGYALCVYDTGKRDIALAAPLPPMGSCTAQACWLTRSTPRGSLVLFGGDGTEGAVRNLRFDPRHRSGPALLVDASGPELNDLLLLRLPVRVQLRSASGPCFEGTFVRAQRRGWARFAATAR
jgi:hypothetical protein